MFVQKRFSVKYDSVMPRVVGTIYACEKNVIADETEN
jgi:hypothetical protein